MFRINSEICFTITFVKMFTFMADDRNIVIPILHSRYTWRCWASAASLGFGSAAPGKFLVFLVPQIEFQAMITVKRSKRASDR